MRLHHLCVTAFGPFPDAVEVDFDEVSRAGLFLIQGPTGAGKTSLLDAICFALYAGVPGSRPGGRALRSDHADRGVVPRVVVDFSTGTRRFRVTRSPEFLRPKRRGPGETRSPASVLLEEHHAGRWVVRSTRADEVGEIVTEVLGMGLEQFSKVVLLPQGEFAAFLRSTAEERRLLLERLFDISTWTGVEEWLVDRRRELATQVAEARTRLDTDLARLGETVATLPAEVVGDLPVLTDLSLGAVPAAVDGIRARCDAHAGDALAALGAADLAVSGAQAARLEAETVGDRQRRGRAAQTLLAALEDAADAHAVDTLRAERAMRAEALAGDMRALRRAVDQDHTAARRLADARTRLSCLGIADWGLSAVRGLQGTLVEREATLTDAHRSCEEARRLRAEVARRSGAAAGARAEVDRLRRRVSEAGAAIVAAGADVDLARASAGDVARLDREVAALEGLRRTLLERDAAVVEVDALSERVRDARDTEQDARERYLARRQARLDGMAAELAGTLAAGEPCGVCGSLEHPAPARGDLAVASDEVVAHEEAWLACRGRVEELTAAVEMRRQLVRTLETDLERAWAAFRSGADARGAGPQRDVPATGAVRGDGDEGVAVGGDDGIESSVLPRPGLEGVTAELEERLLARLEAGRIADRLNAALSRLSLGQQVLVEATTGSSAATDEAVAHQAGLSELRRQLGRRLSATDAAVRAHAECPCVGWQATPAGSLGPEHQPSPSSAPVSPEPHASPGTPALPGTSTTPSPATPASCASSLAPAAEQDAAAWEALEDLEPLLAGHRQVVASVGHLVAALEDGGRARAALAEVRAVVRTSLDEQDFTTVEEAVAGQLPAAALASLRREIRERADRLAAARAVLSDDEVSAALRLPDVDLLAVRTAGEVARQAQRVAQQVQTRAEQSSHRLGGLSQSVLARSRSLTPRLEAAARTAALADTATGIGLDNALRMRLSSFVLAARLEKVATLANERLGVMGDGRYQLQHTDDLAAGGRRSGLGLVVRDLWTGQVRDTASLSGGESFMASLALALGLAEAVREEAGGFDLQTLFIDEGFGTLDDESLEQVLAVLDGLRDGGRAVGVVSHVSDLLTRIPTQICVSKTATGSSVRVLGTPDAAA